MPSEAARAKPMAMGVRRVTGVTLPNRLDDREEQFELFESGEELFERGPVAVEADRTVGESAVEVGQLVGDERQRGRCGADGHNGGSVGTSPVAHHTVPDGDPQRAVAQVDVEVEFLAHRC